MKRCGHCKEEKNEKDFGKHENTCKSCRKERYTRNTCKICKQCGNIFKGNREVCSNKCNILSNVGISIKECWEWQKCCDKKGYGLAKDFDSRTQEKGNKQKTCRTHILSYRIFKGEIPKDLFVCHVCDNPKCCNPGHLWLGNHKDNAQDALKKGRLSLETLTYRRKK